TDPLPYLIAILLLTATAATATVIPALRAARRPLWTALRTPCTATLHARERNPLVRLAAPVYRSAAIAAFAASDGETAAPDFGVRSSWISIRRRGIASVACSVSST